MRLSNLIIGLSFAGIMIILWAINNLPVHETSWSGTIKGLSFSPYRAGQTPLEIVPPTLDELKQDIDLLSTKTTSLRTYNATGILTEVPAIAAEKKLKVTAGAWISPIEEDNQKEIEGLIKLSKENSNINRVLVGNESLLRGDVNADQLIQYLRQVRARVKIPVSTSETWHVWLKYPELANEVDYIAAHILPFWEGIDIENAIPFILERLNDLRVKFPGKKIVLTEVGWPSDGLTRMSAVASPVNQGIFLRRFLTVASKLKLDYFIVEAFDQPWKINLEGGVGAYWGLWDVHRQQKFSFEDPLQNQPNWPILAFASILLALPFTLWLLAREHDIKLRGRMFFAALIQGIATLIVLIWIGYTNRYLTTPNIILAIVMAFPLLLLLLVVLTEAIELGEVLWKYLWRRRLEPVPLHLPENSPKVSIHVPACNEPPDMVIETLNALANLDYPNYEVLFIDNNTKDEALWKPVEAHCQKLGERFKFFHLPKWPGFKAGALNFALQHTDPKAEIIGTIDSDYVVKPEWLKYLVSQFDNPAIALVQAPQDYRDSDENLFKKMCYWEYAGFFKLGMVQRNERDAIIQHGTMALIRKSALEKIGGWEEWCITEDTELGLKLYEAGYQSIYTPQSFGQGLMPDSLTAYKKQRFRWAYGAMQILKHHWQYFFNLKKTTLTLAQRYHFIAGWLTWAADALQLIFIFCALVWTFGMIFWPFYFEPPLILFLIVTLSVFGFKVIKSIWLYLIQLKSGFTNSLNAAIAGLALSHTVGKAIWYGLFTSKLPFLVTPKLENKPALLRSLLMVWEEASIFILLVTGACSIALTRGLVEPASLWWSVMLLIQALPYFAAILFSFVNTFPKISLPSFIKLGHKKNPTPTNFL
ncbi:MAG: glycosyltransferase [Alphaproteobacteria bacterium]|nr:glycosyltransferase [Alphaproteobacteria bacterium]